MPNSAQRTIWNKLHIDPFLFSALFILMILGLFVLYSASGESTDMVLRQLVRLSIAFGVMIFMAQLSPYFYQRWAIPIFTFGVLMLIAVLMFGHIGKGAQRWLDLGFMKFQPSEIMKLAVPMMVVNYLSRHTLPITIKQAFVGLFIVLAPTLLIAKQPDLGTSLLVAASGIFALFLAGLSWRLVAAAILAVGAFLPLLWYFFMHEYQRLRVLTLIDPEKDPLGSGYHIIQSKIAIGSGGEFGKGWLHGTQSQLEFLPERHTDFIFAVFGEEFGLIGILCLLLIYLIIVGRGLYIAAQAQDVFGRLLAGSLTLTFFVYVFVNIGMVSGMLPVVGVPLPLVSYGGTSMVTLMAGFGIIMSIHTHRRMLAH